MSKKNIVIATYSFPEAYPPTLNAITELSGRFDQIYVLSRNIIRDEWAYPQNVSVLNTGTQVSIRDSEKKNFIWKAFSFLRFALGLLRLCIKHKPQVVLVYDPIPLLAFNTASSFLWSKPLLWYHNHDVLDPKHLSKFNLAKLAWKNEQSSFRDLDFFSLPAEERRAYFPVPELKGKYFFIPNLPSLSFYGKFYTPKRIAENTVIRLIYQGHIGRGHGIEEIIRYLLPFDFNGKQLNLCLKGIISKEYQQELEMIACELSVSHKIAFYGFGAYQDVPKLTASCHIGIGIHTGTDIMNATLGTASNKIFEYIALGLPVFLFDSAHFRKHFSAYEWASFTDLSETSLQKEIKLLLESYDERASRAHESFVQEFNFEHYFKGIFN